MVMMIALLQLSCFHSLPPSTNTKQARVIRTPTTLLFSPNISSMRDTRKNTEIPKTVNVDKIKYYYMPNYGYVNFNMKITSSSIKNTYIIIHDTPTGKVASPVKQWSKNNWYYYLPPTTTRSVLWRKKGTDENHIKIGWIKDKKLDLFKKAKQVNITPEEYTFLQDLQVKFKKYHMLRRYLPAIAKTAEILSQENLGNLLHKITISSTDQYNALKSLKGYTSLKQESKVFKAPDIMLVNGWFENTHGSPFSLINQNEKWYWSVYTKQKLWQNTEIKIPETEISGNNAIVELPKDIKGRKKIQITTHSQERPGKKILLSKCNDQYTCSFINIPTEKTYTILWVDEIPHSLVDTTSDPIELRPFQKILRLKVSRNLKIALRVLHKSKNYKALKKMAALKELTAYPISSNGKFFMPDENGTFCKVNSTDYQSCQKKFTPNTRKTVSWMEAVIQLKEPVAYTQTLIHSNKTTAEYIFQTKEDLIFEDSLTRGTKFDVSKLIRRDAKSREH